MKTLLAYSATGVAAGFINGIFGTGGGILLILLFLYTAFPSDKAFATSNLTVMAMSLASFLLYLKNGTLSHSFLPAFFKSAFLPSVLGGAVGAMLLSKFSMDMLKKIFCIMISVGGVGMMLK